MLRDYRIGWVRDRNNVGLGVSHEVEETRATTLRW